MDYNQHNNFQEEEVKLSDYLRIVIQYKWVILIVFLLTFTVTVYYTLKMPKIYEAQTRLLIESKNRDDIFMMNSSVSSVSINNTIEILKSRPVMVIAHDIMKREKGYDQFPISESKDPVNRLKSMITVESKRDTDILTIKCESTDPKEAMDAVNSASSALIKQNTEYSRIELTNIREFLEQQLEQISKRLRNSEEDLRIFKLDEGISILSEETKKLIEQSSNLEAEIKASETEYEVAFNRLNYLKSELGRQDSLLMNVNSVLTSPFLDKLRNEVVALQTRLTKLMMKNDYNSEHPEIIALNNELEKSKESLNREVKRSVGVKTGGSDPIKYRSGLIEDIALAEIEVNVTESKLNSLKNTAEDYDRRMTLLPDTELQLARLQRSYSINEKIHTMLVEKFEDAKISEQAKMGNIRIVEKAQLPERPIKPKKKMNFLIGIVLGLGLGIGSAFLIHSLDTKIRTLDDVENYIKLPILGTIPFIHLSDTELYDIEKQMKKETDSNKIADLTKAHNQISSRLITQYSPKSPISEAYRTLRTNLMSRKSGSEVQTILVTSPGPKEGKSTSISNLAIAIAQMGAKIIIVDLDMRKPMLHQIFDLDKENGASDYLMKEDFKIKNVIKESGIENLDIISSGLVPPNPSELLSSARMDQMLVELKQEYDYVLIDSPPIIAVTDSMILAEKLDHMILVVHVGVTEREIIRRAKEMIRNINVNITGVIVNGIEVQKYYSGYSYYYYYYYYYYGEDTGKKRNIFSKLIRKN